MDKETRKAQESRIHAGAALPEDVSKAQGFANRLRSAFAWVRGIDAAAPLSETTLDGLLIVKTAVQSVITSGEAAERIVRDLIVARADASDGLFVESDTTDTLFLGLPTHPKRFSVENRTRSAFDLQAFLGALVADGILSESESARRVAAATTYPVSRVVAYKPNPTYTEA